MRRLWIVLAIATLPWMAHAADPLPPGAKQIRAELRACRKEAHKSDVEFGAAGMEETAPNVEGLLQCNVNFCRAERRLATSGKLSAEHQTPWCSKAKYQ